jgi:hypothetical protein
MLATLKFMLLMVRLFFKKLGAIADEDESLPPIPRGRPGVDAFTREKMVAYVGTLHMKGYTLVQAKGSAAKKFEVSEATIQRAWDNRGNRGEN